MLKNQKQDVKQSNRPLKINQCLTENLNFAATLKSKYIKLFVSIIKAMNFVNNTEIQLSQEGFKYVVSESKSFQTSAFIKKEFFSFFHLFMPKDLELISFGVNLGSFTDLLSAFLDNDLSSMDISYYHKENRLLFQCTQTDSGESLTCKTRHNTVDALDDDKEDEPAGEMKTEYYVKTMHSVNPIDFDISDAQMCSSLIMNAPDFLNMLNDFDRANEELEIKITLQRMTVKSIGSLQHGSVSKLSCISEIFNKYTCLEPSKYIYKFQYFKVLLKALVHATKISMNTYNEGLMRIQLMMKVDDEQETSAFIEYIMVPSLSEIEELDDA